jgi:Pyruvate/2-oxoacid:ferredoxin oxidoreductase delta subunit
VKQRKPTYLQALEDAIDLYDGALMQAREDNWYMADILTNRTIKECSFCQRQGILLVKNRHEVDRGFPTWKFCKGCEVIKLCRTDRVYGIAAEVDEGRMTPKKGKCRLQAALAELIQKRERYLAKRRKKKS